MSVSSINVPSIIATQYEDPVVASTSATVPTTSSTHNRRVNAHDYTSDLSTSVADESFYDAVSSTASAYDNYSTGGIMTNTTTASYCVSKAVTSVVDSTSVSQHGQQLPSQDQQQYMDTYEGQVGYEDWQNYGYYDETGQYVSYDQSGYYDDQATITEETVGSAAIVATTSAVSTVIAASTATTTTSAYHTESLQYSKDQYDPYTTSSITTTVPSTTTTSAAISGSLQTTEVQVHTHQDDSSYGQYDNTEYYDAEGEVMPIEYGGYDGMTDEYGMGYEGDSYGFTDPAYDQTSIEPSQNLNDKTNLNSKSNIEYNYAYQSAENLSSSAAYDNGLPSSATLDRSNSVSRRASFKRQTSTRDYGYGSETMDSSLSQQYPHSARNSLTPVTTSSSLPPASSAPTTSTSTTLPINSGAAAVGAAAHAANKLTSDIKSALPQLTSFTKAKTGGLFSSGFSKLGTFVSNAAEKTGVPVPPIIKDGIAAGAALGVNKDIEKTNVETAQQQPVVANHVDSTHGKSSIHPGTLEERTKDGYYDDQQPYVEGEGWEGQPSEMDHRRHPQNHLYNDAYDQYEGTEEGPESYASGPVHMDSLESNVSEGGKDPESTIEAQYWQKQKERIAKQNSMAAPDAEGFIDSYDPYDKHKGVFQATIESPVPQNGEHNRQFSKEEYEKQHSLDRDEWLREVDRQVGGSSRPGHLKRGETSDMGMSFDRGDSIDQNLPDDYVDEYMDDDMPRPAKGSIDASGGFIMEPPLPKEVVELVGLEGIRKTSLEMAPDKEKGSKSVSFEEEPPKAIPERQTKTMTPREKWLWAMNRICANLAVSL